MNSVILRTGARFMLALLLLYAVFLLLRGHDEPGGGFIGGLIGAGAFALYGLAFGAAEMRRIIPVSPTTMLGLGLLSGVLSGLFGIFERQPFLTAGWAEFPIGDGFKVGSPLLFDIGVFLVVVGFVLAFVLALEEAEESGTTTPPPGSSD
ncbi:Na+/H+ antiporter subunit B [soil metagenome]